MNSRLKMLAAAISISIVGAAGSAWAANPDTPATATPDAAQAPSTATPPAAGTATAPSTPAGSAPTTSTSTANPGASTPAAGAADASKNEEARKIFDQLDTNHDGSLSFEEFARATFQQPK